MRLARVRQALGGGANVAPAIAFVALIAVGGWLAARWVAYFAAPAEAPAAAPAERLQLAPVARALADAHLFGVAPTGPGGTVVSNLNVKLKGVFAGGESSVAILNTGGKDEAKRVGAELVPGVVLESVHARHVVLDRNGARERVNLEEPVPGAATVAAARPRIAPRPVPAPAPAPVAAPTPAAPTSASPAAPGRSGPGAAYQRPEPYAPVGDVATEPPPAPLAAPAQPTAAGSTQGLVIQSVPPGSMLERLGLQAGDVVRSVNGERVTSEADVARILQQRGIQGSFTAEIQRGGTTIPLAVSGQR